MKKTCPVCNTIFETAVAHKEYDKLNCRKKAERQRARMRDKGMMIQSQAQINGRAENQTIFNPTENDLVEFAKIYLNNPAALPLDCRGNIPANWTPPQGVWFMMQFGVGGNYYTMCSQQLVDQRDRESEERQKLKALEPQTKTPKPVTFERIMAIANKVDQK